MEYERFNLVNSGDIIVGLVSGFLCFCRGGWQSDPHPVGARHYRCVIPAGHWKQRVLKNKNPSSRGIFSIFKKLAGNSLQPLFQYLAKLVHIFKRAVKRSRCQTNNVRLAPIGHHSIIH